MKFAYSAALLITAAILTLPACSKRDREEAKKTSDGSDTFVYVKPDLKKYAKKTSVPDAPANAASTDTASKSNGKVPSPKPETDRKE